MLLLVPCVQPDRARRVFLEPRWFLDARAACSCHEGASFWTGCQMRWPCQLEVARHPWGVLEGTRERCAFRC